MITSNNHLASLGHKGSFSIVLVHRCLVSEALEGSQATGTPVGNWKKSHSGPVSLLQTVKMGSRVFTLKHAALAFVNE